jgi:phosphatidate cytidylyltransferase
MNSFGPLVNAAVSADWSYGSHLAAVIAAVCLGLLVAASVGVLLHRRPGQTALASRIEGYVWSWSALLALLMLAGILGRTAIISAFAALSFQALREFFSLIHTRRADHWALLAAFFVVLPAQYVLIGIDWYGLFAILLPVYVFLLMPVIPALRGDTTRYMDRVAEVQWGLMISVYCLSHVPALLSLDIAGYGGRQTLLITFLVVVGLGANHARSEAAHWLRAPDFDRLRPSAIEFAMAAGTGCLLGLLLSPVTPFPAAIAAGLGVVIAAMGMAGRLVLSAIKRDRGIVDWKQNGATDDETGGLLDRLDTLIFAAPVFFHLTRFLFTV